MPVSPLWLAYHRVPFTLCLQSLPLSASCLCWGQTCRFFFTLWPVYCHCSRQFLSEHNQLSTQTLRPLLSLANTWTSPWSAVDHTSFSPGRKLLSQEKKHTHMNKKLERKEPWRKVKANYKQKNPANGSWENSQSGDLLPVPQ